MSHIDLAGAVEAKKHTRERVVTVAMKEVIFKQPVLVGEIVSFYTSTLKIGTSSVTVAVDVEVSRNNSQVKVTAAELTYVSVNKDGQSIPLQGVI